VPLSNGVVCGISGEAAPGVYAAGDVARIPNAWLDDSPRIEHWTNAVEQAAYVSGCVLAGGVPVRPFESVPYFWSDQYDRKIQFAGRAHPGDEVAIVDGSVDERRLVALYRRGDRLAACLAVSQPRAFVRFRRLLADRTPWAAALASIS
jgi:3-phenylpropionate/trans-cinnamate dioxygenase ferredoxin reductase subunit